VVERPENPERRWGGKRKSPSATQPQEQSSVPNNAPPASTTQTTGEAPRDSTVQQMNEKEKSKVEHGGK